MDRSGQFSSLEQEDASGELEFGELRQDRSKPGGLKDNGVGDENGKTKSGVAVGIDHGDIAQQLNFVIAIDRNKYIL